MLPMLEKTLIGLIAVQALVMIFDEFFYHRRRGLEKFERWGHVADTTLFFAAITLPILLVPHAFNIGVYIFFAASSAIITTKDEWIHARFCTGGEQWCHSILFLLHGAILVALGILWTIDPSSSVLRLLPLPVGLWGIYQFFYWNVLYDESKEKRRDQQSILR